ncbi:MAG: hypothetical protein KJO79_05025 [Verrucomicrobiae bacterium]|nr:hypothetical protein [Verrucomicrobiae bacterium]NNJ86521.1 hypothetical protein [Akkermansiaceae bacterium]
MMITLGDKFRALLATGRVANLPTVWSNVLVGFWISSFFIHEYLRDDQGQAVRLILMLIIMIVASMIYVGGCMLGDAKDIEFDRKNRPNRPLPKGILSVGAVQFASYSLFILAIFGLFASTLLAVVLSYFVIDEWSYKEIIRLISDDSTLNAIQLHEMLLGCLLMACVIVYAFNHKKNKRAALVMMASCRFLLVMLAIGTAHKTFFSNHYSSNSPLELQSEWLKGWMFVYAIAVAAYTLLLSWVASTESKPGAFQARSILTGLLLALPALTFVFQAVLFSPEAPLRTVWATDLHGGWSLYREPAYFSLAVALALTYTWLLFALHGLKTSKPVFVSRALAGFCLLDASFIAAFAPGIAMVCLSLFGLALLLQKATPAT